MVPGQPFATPERRWDALGGPELVVEGVFGAPGPIVLGTFQNGWSLDHFATPMRYLDVLGEPREVL